MSTKIRRIDYLWHHIEDLRNNSGSDEWQIPDSIYADNDNWYIRNHGPFFMKYFRNDVTQTRVLHINKNAKMTPVKSVEIWAMYEHVKLTLRSVNRHKKTGNFTVSNHGRMLTNASQMGVMPNGSLKKQDRRTTKLSPLPAISSIYLCAKLNSLWAVKFCT
jgi:archaellum component FlaF (FlaF/FlaG flagellin family)